MRDAFVHRNQVDRSDFVSCFIALTTRSSEAEAQMAQDEAGSLSFLETAARVKSYLREHGCVSIGGLAREFHLDDAALEQLIDELVDVQRVATRQGKALVSVIAAAETPAPKIARRAAVKRRPALVCDLADAVRGLELESPARARGA